MFTKFEWDVEKEAENLRKHGLDFEEASGVFADPNHLEALDERFPYGEERWNAIGLVQDKIIVVSYTERMDRCRIISARAASASERRRYADSEV